MKLRELLSGLRDYDVTGDENTEITSIAYDSRKVREGALFVCIEGFVSDGHSYISQALEYKAAAIMVQKDISVKGAAVVKTSDTRKGLATVSANFFGNPSKKLKMIGVTGTKGKTTATFMINSIFEKAGKKTALIGTIHNKIGDKKIYSSRTTPESYDLQAFLADCVDNRVEYCITEVSSQGLWLDRVYGCRYETGVFTNLYNDHIGPKEHKNIQEYANAKALLFERVNNAVINIDANYSDLMVKRVKAFPKSKIWTLGIEKPSQIRAKYIKPISEKDKIGTKFIIESPWYNGEIFVGMPGRFNVYNALCAIGCAGIAGIEFEHVVSGLKAVSVKGRVQPVKTGKDFQVVVDYAHNAVSLKNLLKTLREHTKGRIVCVFGCGGDRAKSRRLEMGEVSGGYADFTVITTDNPRTEPPEEILADIENGIRKTNGKYIKIPDRTEAINYAIKNAEKNDMIVIAGKGHENYQIFSDKTIHYDDFEVCEEIISEMDN